jgi:acyl-CoA dehydrogenase
MQERSETVELLAATVARFVREQLIPAEAEVEETDDIPDRILDQLRHLGLFGMTIPESYGGLGLSMSEEVRVVLEIGYASPVFRSYFGTSNGVGTLGLMSDGTASQRRRYLPHIATGALIASFCLTEPDAGSDVASRSRHTIERWGSVAHTPRTSYLRTAVSRRSRCWAVRRESVFGRR